MDENRIKEKISLFSLSLVSDYNQFFRRRKRGMTDYEFKLFLQQKMKGEYLYEEPLKVKRDDSFRKKKK